MTNLEAQVKIIPGVETGQSGSLNHMVHHDEFAHMLEGPTTASQSERKFRLFNYISCKTYLNAQ